MTAISRAKPKRTRRANSPKQAVISKLSWALCWATNRRRAINLSESGDLFTQIKEHYPNCANVQQALNSVIQLDNEILKLKSQQEQFLCFLFAEINKHEKAKPRSKKDGRKAETS